MVNITVSQLNLVFSKIQQKSAKTVRALCFIGGLVTLLLTTLSGRASFFHAHFSYYITLTSTTVWLVCLAYRCRTLDLKNALRHNAIILTTAFIASLMVFCTVKPALRVLADEANLISTSRNMFIQKQTSQIKSGTLDNGEFKPWHQSATFRPALFPFLLNLIHVTKGYDYRNVFILNFITLCVLLCGIGVWVRCMCGPPAAFAAIALIISQPIVSLVSTSGSYDMFFTLFMLICLVALYDYLKNPSDNSFDVLWMSLVLLPQIRNEAFIYSAVMLALLLALRSINPRRLGTSSVVACTPIFILPLIWHAIPAYQTLAVRSPEQQPFGLVHFIRNNASFFLDQLRFELVPPYAKIINIIGWTYGICATTRLVWQWKKITSISKLTVIIFGSAVSCRWVIITSCFWAGHSDPSSYRFYLLPTVLLSISAAFGLYTLLRSRPFAIVAVALACLVVYHPIAINQSKLWNRGVWKEHRIVADYLNRRANQDFILISTQPHKYTIYKFGSVSFASAKSQRLEWLKQKRMHKFGEILVLQTIPYRTMKPAPEQSLDKFYKLETIYEMQIDPRYFIRISRVTD